MNLASEQLGDGRSQKYDETQLDNEVNNLVLEHCVGVVVGDEE